LNNKEIMQSMEISEKEIEEHHLLSRSEALKVLGSDEEDFLYLFTIIALVFRS